jgi:glycosyltransferase involved in cell wall biosynthesis
LKLVILIPAYNEATQIGQLLQKIATMNFSVIVVDDGSNDETAKEAEASGVIVISHNKNRGKGASLETGFKYILNQDFDAVLIMDGDGQHSPNDIQKFIDLAKRHPEAMIIGNRMDNTENMPLDRKLTNMFMSFIISCICRQKIPDSQCGFRLIRTGLLKSLEIESSRFEVESEILIKVSRLKTKIQSVPIDTFYGKEASQINPFWDTFRFIIFLLKLPFIK